MSSNRSFKSSLELSTSASGSPLIARPDAVMGNPTQAPIGHSQKHLLKKFGPPFERYQFICYKTGHFYLLLTGKSHGFTASFDAY